MRWLKYLSFSFSISPSNEHPGLIFRMDWLNLLAVQGLSRVFPNTAGRFIPIILFDVMVKLNLQYFGYLMQRTDSFEKTLMLGKIAGRRRRGRQRMRWLDGITDSMNMC